MTARRRDASRQDASAVPVVGGYELLELLGSGAHGVVHRARRRGRGASALLPDVAVKTLRTSDPAALRRLVVEATALAELDHPHVVALLDVVDDGRSLALVTQLARGGSWKDRLTGVPTSGGAAPSCGAGLTGADTSSGAGTPLRAVAVVAVVAEVADALASAHRRGLVHGDVKPANILLSSEDRALLGDFGTARWLPGPQPAPAGVTPTTYGTPPYAAPEVRAGASPGPAADVHGLAMCAVVGLRAALLPGRAAASGWDRVAQRPSRPTGGRATDPLADLPASDALLDVLRGALALDPAERYPSGAAFAAALAEVPEARGRRLRRSPC